MIKNKHVILNYSILKNSSTLLKENDIFSIRRKGKYKFSKIIKNTKKDNIIIEYYRYTWKDLKMNKQEIYELLKKENIWHEITEHEAAYTMEDLAKIDLPYKEADAKNIFVRDDKKANYYLITVTSEKRVDLKEFKEKYNTRRLSFASENDLLEKLKLTTGSVGPFWLLNDDSKTVIFYLDKDFAQNDDSIIGVHPNENTATVWMKTNDLINIIKKHGNSINIIEI